MSIETKTIENVPAYAMSALINDDWSGLANEDIPLVIDFKTELRAEGWIPSECHEESYSSFCANPHFGLATDTYDLIVYREVRENSQNG